LQQVSKDKPTLKQGEAEPSGRRRTKACGGVLWLVDQRCVQQQRVCVGTASETARVLTRPAVKPAKAKLLSCYERADSAPLHNKPT